MSTEQALCACRHCGRGLRWSYRVDRWVHVANRSRYCTLIRPSTGTRYEAEPVGAT